MTDVTDLEEATRHAAAVSGANIGRRATRSGVNL
jgi:hypothetical protein